MGLIKWIKRELDSSNSCKRRQSEPPLSKNNSKFPHDESYVKALSKFNEWRQKQIIGSSTRLSRKKSKKLLERRGQSDAFLEKVNIQNEKTNKPQNVVTNIDNSLYEEIQINYLEELQNNLRTPSATNRLQLVPVRHSFPVTDTTKVRARTNSLLSNSNGSQIYENAIVQLQSQFDQSPDILDVSKHLLSPPVKFFKENSNPFLNVCTPIRGQEVENNSELWSYQSPKNLKNLRDRFKPFDIGDNARESIVSNRRLSRNPPYQTVINKHGEEVEYALPLNEKLEDERQILYEKESNEIDGGTVTLNNTTNYQQYVDENFQFLNENDRLVVSGISDSFGNNQFHRENVPITDLDKTNETPEFEEVVEATNSKGGDIIKELESLENWSRNISKNIENSIVKKTHSNMHFAEIVVCASNEVVENSPKKVLGTLNGTLHAGTFHCVPVTQFKPHIKEFTFSESTLQLNYEVLRKIRHPDIVLLMGVTVDNKCSLDSLILEPINYSLQHFIYEEGRSLPAPTCLLYTLQINNAVTYLHKNGLIHSNISTHSVVICHLSKAVKLTSFELATTINEALRNELMVFLQKDDQFSKNLSKLPYKLRPYNVEYRKTFSKHNYQAPELLSSRLPFIFPTIQSDVYGICLLLWEMINCSIPFVDFDYDEMSKLVYLQNAQLPTINEEKQKPFENVLKIGLNMIVEKRFPDTSELKEVLNDITLDLDDKTDNHASEENCITKKNSKETISSLLYHKGFGPMICERTSTIKKRKQPLSDNRLAARQLFLYSQLDKSNEPSNVLVPSQTSSPKSPEYGFEIGDISLPETPIARSNKLRKTAWLSNQSISPIVHVEVNSKDNDASINQIQIVENVSTNDTTSNKLYNVNIRIRPNSKKSKIFNQNENSESITENVSPLQKNSSQISSYINYFNLVSKHNAKEQSKSPIKALSPVENQINYNKNITKPLPQTEKNINHNQEEITVNQKSLDEFFNRSHSPADFENSLWRREKQKCDQSVNSQRRISVRDAVNKFESFSKSMFNETNSPKPKKICSSIAPLSNEKNIVSTNDEPTPKDVSSDENVSKLNIVLKGKDQFEEIVKNSEIESESNQFKHSPMLTLNFKKLDRRASDIGSYFIRQNPSSKGLTNRHSIYGTDIFKRLRKPKAIVENETESVTGTNNNKDYFKNKDYKIKVGKLTCLNCGHKLFIVDDIVPSNKTDNGNDGCSEMLLTPLKRNLGLQQVSKSTEDFYIDDDFCEDIELCANMELGTRTSLSDLIDFDILAAEIFNPSEEEFNQIA